MTALFFKLVTFYFVTMIVAAALNMFLELGFVASFVMSFIVSMATLIYCIKKWEDAR